MHKKIALPLVIILPVLLGLVFPLGSCNKADKQQLAMVDSLSAMIDEAHKSMNLDTEKIEERAEEMEERMKVIRMYYREDFTQELARAMDNYRAIHGIYENFIGAYGPLDKELKELDQQVRNLRYSLKQGTLKGDAFNEAYHREKSDILRLKEEINRFVTPVFETEKLYKEIDPLVEEIAEKAEKSKPKQ